MVWTRELSWSGAVLMGKNPGWELSWWGTVLVDNHPGGVGTRDLSNSHGRDKGFVMVGTQKLSLLVGSCHSG